MKRSSADYKRLARITLKGKYPLPMAGVVLYGLGMVLCSMIAGAITGFTKNNAEDFSALSWVLYLLVIFVIALIASVVSAGLTYMILNLCRGKAVALSDMLYMFKEHPDRVILVSVLLELVMAVCMLPYFIFNLLIALSQGINLAYYVLSLFFMVVGVVAYIAICLPVSLSIYLLVDDHELGAIDAMKKSISLMRGNNGRLLYLQLSFIGLYLLSVLTCYVGALWIMPYKLVTICLFYLDRIGELDTLPVAQRRPAGPLAVPPSAPAPAPPAAEPSAASSYAPADEPPAGPIVVPPSTPADESPAGPSAVPPTAPADEPPARPFDVPPSAPAEESPARPFDVPPSAPAEESPARPFDVPPSAPAEESPARPFDVPPSVPVDESSAGPAAESPVIPAAASSEMPEQASAAEEKEPPKSDEPSVSDGLSAVNRPPVSDLESTFPKADWDLHDEGEDKDK